MSKINYILLSCVLKVIPNVQTITEKSVILCSPMIPHSSTVSSNLEIGRPKPDIIPGKLSPLQLCLWWQKPVFWRRPRDISIHVCGNRNWTFFPENLAMSSSSHGDSSWSSEGDLMTFIAVFMTKVAVLKETSNISGGVCGDQKRYNKEKHDVFLSTSKCVCA